jgi:hypothetical protein
MAADRPSALQPPKQVNAKRKREAQPEVPAKKPHSGPNTAQLGHQLRIEPHEALLTELRPKYGVLVLSVLSSSKIEQRVTRMLEHLGRTSLTDLDLLPGVVLLHARDSDVAKMITMAEIVRRRIHESDQKWYQYNRLYHVETEVPAEPTVIEDTLMALEGENGIVMSDGDDDAFESMPPRHREALIEKAKTTSRPYMSIFLSRLPISELRGKDDITYQSNESQIEAKRRKQVGLA